MKRLIAEQWRRYLKGVVPAGADEDQVTDTRNAFYGGAASLFGAIMSILEPGKEATDNDVAVMDEISKELQEHVLSVVRGGEAGPAPGKTLEVYDRGPAVQLFAWCPTPDGTGPAKQIHMLITFEVQGAGKLTQALRFKTAEGTDRFVERLQALRKEVWP